MAAAETVVASHDLNEGKPTQLATTRRTQARKKI
jgi:hypothetical protein